MIIFIKSFLFVILIFVFSSSIYANRLGIDSSLDGRTKSIYFESNALFKCQIRLPVNYNPQKKYVLIVGLHGGGSSLDQFITIWDSLKNTEFIFAVPQAPYSWLIKNEIGYDWALWPSGNKKFVKRASNLIGKYTLDLTTILKKQYSISDVYLLGFSQGAVFTYIAGMQNYNIYKGLIILSGPGLLEPLISPFTGEPDDNWIKKHEIKSSNNLRIFIGHGKNDKLADYKLGRISQNILLKFGYDVTFKDFDGGHSVNNMILESVIKWIKQ